jgi:predicted transcriptional regulator
MTREKVTLTVELPQKSKHTLPKEVADILRGLALKERRAYSAELSKAGWTLQCIADVLNITRESIRLYETSKTNNESEVRKAIASLPIPPIPTRTLNREVINRVQIPNDVLTELKELYSKAKLVRGRGKKYRQEAEDFTQLAYAQVERGVSVYAVAKALGITTSALQFRFARYGYKTGGGKSIVYRPLTHRLQAEGEANAELVQ